MSSTYGVISDYHQNPTAIPPLVHALKDVDALILNGDIGSGAAQIACCLEAAASTGKPVYAQPGSHEGVLEYTLAMEYVRRRRDNIIDCTGGLSVDRGDHALIFLPGSDWHASGQFALWPDVERGLYLKTEEGLGRVPREWRERIMLDPLASENLVENVCTKDLAKYVTAPERTVVFCHVPPRFDSKDAIDVAYFAENREDKSVMPGVALESQIRAGARARGLIINDSDVFRIAWQNGYELKRENRGNEALGDAYREAGITKAVSGHFHESVHRAHDAQCRPVAPSTMAAECFLDASYADAGKASIITVDGAKMGYALISLP